jgi:hypothetical protein
MLQGLARAVHSPVQRKVYQRERRYVFDVIVGERKVGVDRFTRTAVEESVSP